jgi:hypothetical protein
VDEVIPKTGRHAVNIDLPPRAISDIDQRTTALNHWLDGMIEAAREERPANTPTTLIVALATALKRMVASQHRMGRDAVRDTLAIAVVRLAAAQDAVEGELL